MEGFAYVCAVLLAAAFVRAGAAKLARPALTAAGFKALAVPLPAVAARAVPLTELALAAVLLAAPAPAAVASLLALAAFSVVVARAVRAGSVAGCTCFGRRVSAEPVSRSDLVRNGLLAGLALGALDASGPTAPSGVAVALMAAASVGGLALLRLARRSPS